ncbi:hypothetical protein V501_05590, partial [Pseudogymnoascus sp. VKM F-4519 (FW-2642)]
HGLPEARGTGQDACTGIAQGEMGAGRQECRRQNDSGEMYRSRGAHRRAEPPAKGRGGRHWKSSSGMPSQRLRLREAQTFLDMAQRMKEAAQ